MSTANATQAEKAETFLVMHRHGDPLVVLNPWDAGSAKLFVSLGVRALATTSGGFAASRGRLDGGVSLDEVLVHAREIVDAVDVPVSADFENGFADDPPEVARNVERAIATGLAGCSVEDFTRHVDAPIYDLSEAVARVAAAAEVAHAGPVHFVLTARCENYAHGRPDLADTIRRLEAYQEAGADVLFATGVRALGDVRSVVASVDRPVNVLASSGGPSVAQLAAAGAARISIGGSLAYLAYGAAVGAAREVLESGTFGPWDAFGTGYTAVRETFSR